MTPPAKLDLEGLKAKAEAATPGPWAFRYGDIVQLSDGGQGYPIDHYTDCKDVIAGFCGNDESAEYVAAASPDVILSLLAKLAEVTAARDEACERLASLMRGEPCASDATRLRIIELRKAGT
jgi:hypothetical protein